jgi:hypothetical protein
VLAVGPVYRRFTGWVAALGSAENVYTETESTKAMVRVAACSVAVSAHN